MERHRVRARSVRARLSSLTALCLATLGACSGGEPVAPRDATVDDVRAADDAVTPAEAGDCVDNATCDDGVTCTVDRCDQGRCVHAPLSSRCDAGLVCDLRQGCVDPACGLLASCPGGVDGGAACVDLGEDTANCGRCGTRCPAGDRCDRGACVNTPGSIGTRCTADTECAMGLRCERGITVPRTVGLCTKTCPNPGATPDEEQAACGGPNTTCIAAGVLQNRCVRSCDPTARTVATGGCPRGQVCSGQWIDRPDGMPDFPGCVGFCTSDSECAGNPLGTRCSLRTGLCGRAVDILTLQPDGFPCDPGGVAQCRGFCLEGVDHDPTHGICASLVQRQVTPACPDDPDRVQVRGYPLRDNIGLCSFRRCATNCECPTGLLCLHSEDPPGVPDTRSERFCQYRTDAQPEGVPCR